ncbi:hypothetical protein AYI68_g4275 [Smittium mucronatum]|uniref:LITAF domain-containing protein n=1 Tax=Smittium mucronatum TaxID=133383 RepID=A0A1R0GXJ1_9FUNG|nr:hypothetical protein AYI68_g4275 [Smittium mucronatum]
MRQNANAEKAPPPHSIPINQEKHVSLESIVTINSPNGIKEIKLFSPNISSPKSLVLSSCSRDSILTQNVYHNNDNNFNTMILKEKSLTENNIIYSVPKLPEPAFIKKIIVYTATINNANKGLVPVPDPNTDPQTHPQHSTPLQNNGSARNIPNTPRSLNNLPSDAPHQENAPQSQNNAPRIPHTPETANDPPLIAEVPLHLISSQTWTHPGDPPPYTPRPIPNNTPLPQQIHNQTLIAIPPSYFQPTPYATPIIDFSAVDTNYPIRMVCPYCNIPISTSVELYPGTQATLCSLLTCLIFWPLFWVPLCSPVCLDRVHTCPNCSSVIAITSPQS